MIHAKNYENASKFAKVMPRILWLLFSGHSLHVHIGETYLLST